MSLRKGCCRMLTKSICARRCAEMPVCSASILLARRSYALQTLRGIASPHVKSAEYILTWSEYKHVVPERGPENQNKASCSSQQALGASRRAVGPHKRAWARWHTCSSRRAQEEREKHRWSEAAGHGPWRERHRAAALPLPGPRSSSPPRRELPPRL